MSYRSATCLISINYPFLSLLPFFFHYSDISKVVHHFPSPNIEKISKQHQRRMTEEVAQISSYAYFCHFSLPSVVHFRSEPLGLDLRDVAQCPFQASSPPTACVEKPHTYCSGLNSRHTCVYCYGSLSYLSTEWYMITSTKYRSNYPTVPSSFGPGLAEVMYTISNFLDAGIEVRV